MNLEEIFMRPGVCKIESCAEVLTGFRFKKLGAGAGSAFERLARRRALSLPVLNCGAVVQLDAASARFESAAIALGPVAPLPFRPREAEEMLAGAPVNDEIIRAAAARAMEVSQPRTSLVRASREYRREMVAVLTRRALTEAVAQALRPLVDAPARHCACERQRVGLHAPRRRTGAPHLRGATD